MLTSTREQIDNIRVIRVTKLGKDVGFSGLCDKLATIGPDGFVAIDTEFSGMGTDPDLRHENLETRYAALRKLADTRAIFSVGIAIFDKLQRDTSMTDPKVQSLQIAEDALEEKDCVEYEVATFDLLMSCQSEFSLSANAGEFLTSHFFDFNEMFQRGIPYDRASTEKAPEKEVENGLTWRWGKMPRGLLWRIGRQAIPLVVHNGLLDLAFLFAAFQGPLPETLHGFIVALLECVPAGYYDTKLLASAGEEKASFLGYLFARSVLGGIVGVSTATRVPSNDLTDPKEDLETFETDVLCALYALRGFCPRGTRCPFQHDPFMVVADEKNGKTPKDTKDAHKRQKLQAKQLKRQKAETKSELSKLSKKQQKKFLDSKQKKAIVTPCATGEETGVQVASHAEGCDRPKPQHAQEHLNQAHTAGWDAFCTGYVFAAYRASLAPDRLEKHRNRIALPYKTTSLFLCRSRYAELDADRPSNEMKPEGGHEQGAGK